MKVLHVGLTNIAGVPGLLVEGLRQREIEADLIVYERHAYGFPYEKVLDGKAKDFLLSMLRLSRHYNIVHFHGFCYRFNIDIFTLKFLRHRLIVHLHGTELRTRFNDISAKAALKISNQVLVSTPDLLAYYPKAEWLPNPIDPVFKLLKNPRRDGKAVYFKKWYEPEGERAVKTMCREMNLELSVQSEPIPYNEMPLFLNQFEVFFDRFAIPSLSKTALEALACGCRVISWKGVIRDPEKIIKNHSLPVVTEKLIKIYEELLF